MSVEACEWSGKCTMSQDETQSETTTMVGVSEEHTCPMSMIHATITENACKSATIMRRETRTQTCAHAYLFWLVEALVGQILCLQQAHF